MYKHTHRWLTQKPPSLSAQTGVSWEDTLPDTCPLCTHGHTAHPLPPTRRHKRAASSHLHVRSHILAFPHVHGPGGCPCCAHESVYGTKREDASLSSTQLCEHRCVPSPHAHSSRGSHAWRGPKGLNNQKPPLAWASRSWTRHELGAGIRFFLRTGKTERETCHSEGWTAGRRPRSPASWNRAGSLRRVPSPAPLWLCALLVTCLTTRATAQKRDSVTPN